MKSFLTVVFACCTFAVVFGQLQPCFEQAECEDANQCCSGFPPFGGFCTNLTIAGAKCHLIDRTVALFGDFIIGPCPCAEGLECVQSGKKKNDGICQLPATTTAAVPAEEPSAGSAE